MLCCSSSATTDAVVSAPKNSTPNETPKATLSSSEQPIKNQDESLKQKGTEDFLSAESPAKKKVTIAEEVTSASNEKPKQTKAMMRQTVRDVTVPLSKEEGTFLDDIKLDTINLLAVEHLGKRFESEAPKGMVNTMGGKEYMTPDKSMRMSTFVAESSALDIDWDGVVDQSEYNKLIGEKECVIGDIVRVPNGSTEMRAYVRAGPRRDLHFNPKTVNAAIVTCGGLCPGLNNVVREITRTLISIYGIKGKVYGIQGGYAGFDNPDLPPIELTMEVVEDIHHKGGTVLSSSRGGFDIDKIMKFIQTKKIKQLYVIGGDGTHRGAFCIHEECMAKGINVAVAGIPKTIDKDIDYLDRTFGFQSAIEAAQKAIHSAKTEATCNLPNGIGIVKLMGRSAGYIAAHATLGSGDVDLCLVPESGTKRICSDSRREGAGEEILGESAETDASGNKKLPAIGEFMKKATEEYFKKQGETATVKYIDPSYMVCSVPGNAADSLYCMNLAQNAVHGTMTGFTGFSVGLTNNKTVMLPIPELVATSPRHMNPVGRTWERVVALTRQPNLTKVELQELEAKSMVGVAHQYTVLDDIQVKGVYLSSIEHLSKKFKSEAPERIVNTMRGFDYDESITESDSIRTSNDKPPSFMRLSTFVKDLFEDHSNDDESIDYNKHIVHSECVIHDIVVNPGKDIELRAFPRAGPREKLHFNPKTVNAAIVTCGGLCPGLNNVVRAVTHTLKYTYGIGGKVYGIRGGYRGFYDEKLPPVELTPALLENIHHKGGTVLASSRGGFDIDKIYNFILEKKVKMLFIIGGDGSHRGAFRIHEECMAKGLNVAVAGIPKTIDNDIDYLDRTFGFQSAVEAAQEAIRSAKTEATCNLPNGIVKLMGRSAGYIAAYATLGSGDVDLCLVPEVPIQLEGKNGVLPFLYNRVKKKGYAVIVVAEGAGEEILGESAETDASGNKKLPAIGEFMKKATEGFFKGKGETATVKYIDPSYMVCSVPGNAADSLYCMNLAQNAVHGTMAGYTGFSVGLTNNKLVMLPIPQLVATSPRHMRPFGRTWERVVASTGQPNNIEG